MTDQKLLESGKELEHTDTKDIKLQINPEMEMWVDTSIQNQTLNILEICEICAKDTESTTASWRSRFYHTWKKKGFQDWWYDQYRSHFKKRATAKVYGKIDKLIDNARHIEEVIQAGEFLEGKNNTQQTNIQINNNVESLPDDKLNDILA